MTERQMPSGASRPNLTVVSPTDRVRWGPVWAGLFIAVSTWVVLSVLGLGIGLSAYDPGKSAQGYGWGAAIWAGVSAIIAFILGGWWAARTAAVRGESNGLINGVMVWAVGVPLLFLLFGAGMAPVLATRGDQISNRARQAAAQLGATPSGTEQPGEGAMTPATTSNARQAAWGTLVALLLGLGASALGGFMGARGTDVRWRTRGEPDVPAV